MKLLRLVLLLMVLGIPLPAHSSAVAAQEVDAYSLLRRSEAAMRETRSMRATAHVSAETRTQGGRLSFDATYWGEAQGLARQHYFQDPGASGLTVTEYIIIEGEGWVRWMPSSEWTRLDSGIPYFTPFLHGDALPDLIEYLLDPEVADEGRAYRVSGALDFERMMAEQADAFLDSGLAFGSESDLVYADASAVWTLEKATLYTLSVESISTAMFADGGEQSSTLFVAYSDFNDPAIRVDPPIPPTPARAPSVATPTPSSAPRPPVPEPDLSAVMVPGAPAAPAAYIRGMAIGDANLVWDSYSARARANLERRGVTREGTQRQLNQAIESGNLVIRATYVGSYPLQNGSMHFYVVVRSGRGAQAETHVPYVFTLDSEGNIERID